MQKWQKFEALVAAMHQYLNGSAYVVETDVKVYDARGTPNQVDVVMRPKTPFAGPVLISCKAWQNPVGIEHVREWADIVQQTGASNGLIVAEKGFTQGAKDAARVRTRRVSLWQPRLLVDDDFKPDDNSRHGYVRKVEVDFTLRAPRLVEGSFQLNVARADSPPEGRKLRLEFSAARRHLWDLYSDSGKVEGNLWDKFQSMALSVQKSCKVEYVPSGDEFVVMGDVKLRVNGLSFEILVDEVTFDVAVDLAVDAMCYQNVLTRETRLVPMSALPTY